MSGQPPPLRSEEGVLFSATKLRLIVARGFSKLRLFIAKGFGFSVITRGPWTKPADLVKALVRRIW
jgi:hypothetical protein